MYPNGFTRVRDGCTISCGIIHQTAGVGHSTDVPVELNFLLKRTFFGFWRPYHATQTGKRALAAKFLRQIERDIENNRFVVEGDLDFASAAIAYMKAGGERRFLTSLIRHFGNAPLRQIGQAEIDEAAAMLYP